MTKPLSPPPELVQQWLGEFFDCTFNSELSSSELFLTTRAAQWGADQELEACCEWLANSEVVLTGKGPDGLRSDRRPKPPSAKEQALTDLGNAYNANQIDDTTYENILRALETLPE